MKQGNSQHSEEATSSNSFNIFSKDSLDILFKIPLAISGFFYVSGIFVQGLYFGRYGINTLNLFKLSYIIAGFWAVFVIILPAFLLGFGAFLLFKPDTLRLHYKTKFPSIIDKLVRIAIICIITGIYSLIVHSIFPFLVKTYSDLFQILWLALAFFVVTSLTFLSVEIVLKRFQHSKAKILLLILYPLIVICVYIGCLDSFSKTIYLNIPAHLGGGNSITVNLIFKGNQKEISFLEQEMNTRFERGVESNQDNKKTEDTICYFAKALLIVETDAGFYLKAENNKVVFLRRDSILHITYFETVF